jgi:hypothetical protein
MSSTRTAPWRCPARRSSAWCAGRWDVGAARARAGSVGALRAGARCAPHARCTPTPAAPRAHSPQVYKGRVLRDGAATLSDAGIGPGDVVVLLCSPGLPPPSAPVTSPVPDGAALRAAMADEARLRGLDPAALAERAPPGRGRRGAGGIALNLPPDLLNMDPRLLQMLQQALDGSGLLAGLGEQLAAAGGGGGAEGEYELEDVVPPEPPAAAVAQLTDMGFAGPLARKALLLSRHSVDLALEWLLQHGEEPGADAPPTQEELRAVWGARRRRRRAAAAAAGAAPAAAAAAVAAAAAEGERAASAAALAEAAAAAAAAQAGAGPSGAAASAAASPAAAAPPGTPAGAAPTPAPAPAAAPAPASAPAPVDEADVAMLTDMGFTAEAAAAALRRFRGSVNAAVGYLLQHGGAPPPEGGSAPGAGGAGGSGAAAAPVQAGGDGDHAMASPRSAAEGDGDMHMADAGSPPRGGARGGGGGGGPAAQGGAQAAQAQQQQQQPQRGGGENEEEMMDAEEGFGMEVGVAPRALVRVPA